MVLAFLLTGIVTGLGASAAVLFAGWGLLAAAGAYAIGGMLGTLLCILATYPFGTDPGDPPAAKHRATRAPKEPRLVPARARIA